MSMMKISYFKKVTLVFGLFHILAGILNFIFGFYLDVNGVSDYLPIINLLFVFNGALYIAVFTLKEEINFYKKLIYCTVFMSVLNTLLISILHIISAYHNLNSIASYLIIVLNQAFIFWILYDYIRIYKSSMD